MARKGGRKQGVAAAGALDSYFRATALRSKEEFAERICVGVNTLRGWMGDRRVGEQRLEVLHQLERLNRELGLPSEQLNELRALFRPFDSGDAEPPTKKPPYSPAPTERSQKPLPYGSGSLEDTLRQAETVIAKLQQRELRVEPVLWSDRTTIRSVKRDLEILQQSGICSLRKFRERALAQLQPIQDRLIGASAKIEKERQQRAALRYQLAEFRNLVADAAGAQARLHLLCLEADRVLRASAELSSSTSFVRSEFEPILAELASLVLSLEQADLRTTKLPDPCMALLSSLDEVEDILWTFWQQPGSRNVDAPDTHPEWAEDVDPFVAVANLFSPAERLLAAACSPEERQAWAFNLIEDSEWEHQAGIAGDHYCSLAEDLAREGGFFEDDWAIAPEEAA